MLKSSPGFDMEAILGFAGASLVGFGAWIVNAIYARPTRQEVERIEDRIIEEMREMEKRLVETINAAD